MRKPSPKIENFAQANHDHTKQHVRLFTIEGYTWNLSHKTILKGHNPFCIVTPTSKCVEYFYLIPLVLSYVAGVNPVTRGTLDFLWPVKVRLIGDRCELYMTIMEMDISTYVPEAENIRRSLSEERILESLASAFYDYNAVINPLDINKGIKTLWALDLFDSIKVSYKSSIASHSESLDNKKTLKKHDPLGYQAAISQPLRKTAFISDSKQNFPPIWSCDPTYGALIFTRYNADINSARSLIEKIINSN